MADANAREAHEQMLRDRDLGSFTLALDPFDWDPKTLASAPVSRSELPTLAWELRYPDAVDPETIARLKEAIALVERKTTPRG